ncbi:NAD(P)H-hydrate dehydratase, partial [Enterococcus faecium]
ERLSGLKIGQQTKEEVQDFVNQLGAIVVAKSSETRIFAPNQESFILKIGSPAQATGGMGDTLAGMVGGFLAQFHGEAE